MGMELLKIVQAHGELVIIYFISNAVLKTTLQHPQGSSCSIVHCHLVTIMMQSALRAVSHQITNLAHCSVNEVNEKNRENPSLRMS